MPFPISDEQQALFCEALSRVVSEEWHRKPKGAQRRAAERLGIAESAMSRFMNGRGSNASQATYESVMRLAGCTATDAPPLDEHQASYRRARITAYAERALSGIDWPAGWGAVHVAQRVWDLAEAMEEERARRIAEGRP